MKTSSPTLNRRTFIKGAAVAAATASFSARSWSQVNGSNSDIRCAVVGVKSRGESHIGGFKGQRGVRLVALCDIDEDILNKQAKKIDGNVTQHRDIRKLLEDKDIDAISIAAPNHWHSLATIWAIQAGKDVYVEKPVSHNVSEGRRMVEFARKHEKIVQTGTQSRSSIEGIKQAVEWVKAGNLGKILVARGLCYKSRPSIGKVNGPQPIPAKVDYDLWCGPAEMLPLTRKSLHYDWHWVWNTGNGDLGNQGIHQMDIARWFLGEKELAPRVWSMGGRLGYDDDGETPNTQIVYQDYAKAPLIFEVRGLPDGPGSKKMDKFMGASVGVLIHCEGGHVLVPDYKSATAFDKDGQKIKEFKGEDDHYVNFIKAVQSRNHNDLNADILEGHLSSALCHTGNISYKLGQRLAPGEALEKIKGIQGAAESFGRMSEHLKTNGVDLTKDLVNLGPPLEMNPHNETFVDDQVANAMLTRNYRRGFVVPDKA